jgi:hypothetical protein
MVAAGRQVYSKIRRIAGIICRWVMRVRPACCRLVKDLRAKPAYFGDGLSTLDLFIPNMGPERVAVKKYILSDISSILMMLLSSSKSS